MPLFLSAKSHSFQAPSSSLRSPSLSSPTLRTSSPHVTNNLSNSSTQRHRKALATNYNPPADCSIKAPEVGEYTMGPRRPAITSSPCACLLGPASGEGDALRLPLLCIMGAPSLRPLCGGPTFIRGRPAPTPLSTPEPLPETLPLQPSSNCTAIHSWGPLAHPAASAKYSGIMSACTTLDPVGMGQTIPGAIPGLEREAGTTSPTDSARASPDKGSKGPATAADNSDRTYSALQP
ncbi:hypothetical protein E4T56_gene11984 [Termitomyces sp. T112]|nr:hypothetical protein E4T56_gene11984 [Termitomyces sp. T112]